MSQLLCGRGVPSVSEEDKENQGCLAVQRKALPSQSVRMGKGALAYRQGNKAQATTATKKPLASNGESLQTKNPSIPEYNSNVSWMDSHTVVLKKGRFGYGFSVTGSSPTRVSCVKADSPADHAGLQRGDYIVKLNGQNVSRSMADSVANIIRYSDKQIVMDIHRSETAPSICSDTSDIESVVSWRQSTPLGGDQASVVSSHQSALSSFSGEQRLTSYTELSQSTLSLHSALPRLDSQLQSLGCQDRERHLAVERLHTLEAEFVHRMMTGLDAYLRPLSDCGLSRTEHSTLFHNIDQISTYSECHLSCLQQSLQSNSTPAPGTLYRPQAQALANAYEAYCNGLKNAFRLLIELSEDGDFKALLKSLTQNAKSLSISQFLQKPLQHIKDLVLSFQDIAVNTPVDHHDYDNTKLVIEALRGACNRINESNTRRYSSSLSLSSGHSRSSGQSSRSQEESHMSSPNKSSGQCNTSDSGIQDTTLLDTSMSSDHSRSSASSRSSQHSRSSQKTKLTEATRTSQQTKSTSDQSMVSIASVDSEVLDIQTRLVLPDHMPAMQLATATRHMIYAGDLYYFDGLLWTQLYVVLLSDLLLLTRPEDDHLTLWEQPLVLSDIVEVLPNGVHACEFKLTVRPGALPSPPQSAGAPERTCLSLQAPTVELKSTWTNVLSQRMSAYRAQTTVNMDNVV